MMQDMAGTLYLCATPIGNLEDITLRTLKLLESVDVIAAEDTRNTLKLLNRFEIKTPMTSYHEHNKMGKGPFLIEKLLAGESIALVTDAGMPGISDPGADLVKLCYEAGVPVTVAPGASAAVVALVLSGLNTRRFVFEGFLPADKKERRMVLQTLEREHRTMIFYEAPHRLLDTLEELEGLFGAERESAAVRELTKKFEEVRRDSVGNQRKYFTENPPKGEFVLVIAGLSLEVQKKEAQASWAEISVGEHMQKYLQQGFNEKDAMKQVAKDRGVSKRDIYKDYKMNE
ncbi:ribosomal RNA small subunit methyltransferase I [Anaerotignum neopropionicum]|uniref:Ribosomal RNA small subunit methyltransferase I n=2 Tax=Anaerotignum neopropionicum TaxID=36847 RepID=A0A136WBB8_9FIRM|nr:16S rRNA (cytidine(1402)-2'-O)-methyltransferase [Anaerotignum neopropionicum]KXL51812.1 ribosomal RNA small subunit methyltransferase I [Anaerotignum neopropionicum]